MTKAELEAERYNLAIEYSDYCDPSNREVIAFAAGWDAAMEHFPEMDAC